MKLTDNFIGDLINYLGLILKVFIAGKYNENKLTYRIKKLNSNKIVRINKKLY